jgi:hypothetical protein
MQQNGGTNESHIGDYLDRSISHGTMRSIDLLKAFLPVLEDLDSRNQKYADTIREGQEFLNLLLAEESGSKMGHGFHENLSMYINEDLWDAMNFYAPSGYYFGANEGDGSDYGFWQSREEEDWDSGNETQEETPA